MQSINPINKTDFFRENPEKIDWISISANTSLSEDFFEENIKKVDWEELNSKLLSQVLRHIFL